MVIDYRVSTLQEGALSDQVQVGTGGDGRIGLAVGPRLQKGRGCAGAYIFSCEILRPPRGHEEDDRRDRPVLLFSHAVGFHVSNFYAWTYFEPVTLYRDRLKGL